MAVVSFPLGEKQSGHETRVAACSLIPKLRPGFAHAPRSSAVCKYIHCIHNIPKAEHPQVSCLHLGTPKLISSS